MDDTTLRDLVDDLPTESLTLYVQHYEAGEVGGYLSAGKPRRRATDRALVDMNGDCCRCPRACLGFRHIHGLGVEGIRTHHHPAYRIEGMALDSCTGGMALGSWRGDNVFTPAALYSECLLSLAQRAAQTEALKAERDREVARV